ncbi:MAG: aldo/keto reductase [Myxococcota bacterium]
MTPRTLGTTGITVFPIGLGGMPMSIAGRPDRARSLDTLKSAFESGIDFVDTADVYCLDDADLGHNERLIAEAIRRFAQGRAITVATKGGCTRPEGRWDRDGRPEHLKAACDRSLAALGVERIDLYQLHAPDDRVKFADSIGALAELRAAGKVAHVGLSNVTVKQIAQAAAIVPIASVQNRCSVHDTRAFRDGVVDWCTEHGVAFLPYSPVGGSRGIGRVASDPTLVRIARACGATAPQVALAWLLAKSPVIVPIPGASRPENAARSARAAAITLPDEQVAEIDAAFLGG